MKVFVTGATGMVGAHTTLELLRAGHSVRLLVRNRDKADNYFAKLGVTIADYIVGDMRDADTIRRGLAGCDALFHAAAVVGIEKSQADLIYRSNIEALRAVIDTAVDAGVPNIIYVSSIGALCNDRRVVKTSTIDESAELFDQSTDAYRRSKTDCERYVRSLQERGAPIQITYPTAILGPDDPGFSESNFGLQRFLTQLVPQCSSGFQIIDVRDLAMAHRLLIERVVPADRSQARYVIGGHFCTWPELGHLIDQVMGKRMFKLWMPDSWWYGIGVLLDQIKKVITVDFPLTEEVAFLVTCWTPVSSARAERALALKFRPVEQTLHDTIAWMYRAGHLQGKPANAALLKTT
jgi:nucleoside-diphosphate-sugar epimerase